MPKLSEVIGQASTAAPRRLRLSQVMQPADFGDVTGGSSVAPPLAERYAAAGINPNVTGATGESFLDNAAAGFGSSYVDLKDSARQLVANQAARGTGAVRAFNEAVPGIPLARDIARAADEPVQGYKKSVQADIDAKKARDQPLDRTGGGLVGNAAGLLSQLLLPGSALKGAAAGPKVGGLNSLAGIAGRALMPSTVRGSIAQGAALGAAQPTASDESTLGNAALGGLAGGAGALLGKGIGAVARGANNALLSLIGRPTQTGLNRQVAQVLRSEAADPNAIILGTPSSVQGVQRSLAEETLDPGIARLERLSRSKGGTWGDVDRANNDARINALSRFAGTDTSIGLAKKARSGNAKPLLDQALRVEGVDSAPVISALDDLMKSAQGRPAVQSGLAQVRTLLNRVQKGADGEDMLTPEDRLNVLNNVRKTIGDMLSGKYGGDSAAALAGSRELISLKDSLDEALTGASPEFGQYLGGWIDDSVPIGRMQIGRELLEKGGAIPDAISGNTVLTPAQFSKATANLDRVAAKATGFKKAEASRYLEPDDRDTINAIQDDLQRRSFAATAGSGGNSQTFERLAGNDRLSRGVASRLADRIPLFGAASQYLRERGQQRLEEKLALTLMYPDQARAILASVPVNDRKLLQDALTRGGGLVGSTSAQSSE